MASTQGSSVRRLLPAILEFFISLDGQRCRVQPIAQAGRARAVVKDVARVALAARAKNLRAVHAVTAVGVGDDVLGGNRLEETRPAGAGIEFGFRGEQRQSAADAIINAGLVVVVESAAKSRFGALGAGNFILIGRQLLLPLGIGLDYLRAWSLWQELALVIRQAHQHGRRLIGLSRWLGGRLAGGRRQ